MEYTELYLLVSGGGDSVILISKINLYTYKKILNMGLLNNIHFWYQIYNWK